MPATIASLPIDNHRAVLEKTLEDNKDKKIYVYLYASEDPATGKSWCPDCVKAEPLVQERFARLEDTVLLRAATGDRPTWRDPNNVYRVDKEFAAKSVPTLIRWTASGPAGRLVEDEVLEEDKLDALLAQA